MNDRASLRLHIIQAVVKRFPAVMEHLSEEALTFIKAAGDMAAIHRAYHDGITSALIGYFEGGGNVTAPRNEFMRATLTAFNDTFDTGWLDAGAELPLEPEALDWIEARINEEFGFIEALFQDAKELRKDKDFDYFSWITARADGYTHTLSSVYTQAKMMASRNIVLEFGGSDGKESCPDCQKMKGRHHTIKYILAHNLIPAPGNKAYECEGWQCEHFWFNPKTGEEFKSLESLKRYVVDTL